MILDVEMAVDRVEETETLCQIATWEEEEIIPTPGEVVETTITTVTWICQTFKLSELTQEEINRIKVQI